MTTIRLLDARRGLNIKCRELFRDEKIADAIYRYLCDGIEECEDAEPEQKTGVWEEKNVVYKDERDFDSIDAWQSARCSKCGKYHTTPYGYYFDDYNFCPNCGSYNGECE